MALYQEVSFFAVMELKQAIQLIRTPHIEQCIRTNLGRPRRRHGLFTRGPGSVGRGE